MQRFGKKVLAWALAIGILLPGAAGFASINAGAEEYTQPATPTVDAANKRYFANGTDLRIYEESGKTYVSPAGSQEKQEIGQDWSVYAGGKDSGNNYNAVSITMEGGKVDYIIGSNRSAGKIETSSITVKKGTVGMVIANQGGNSAGASSYDQRKTYYVGTSNITVDGGEIQAIAGTYGYTYTGTVNMKVTGGYLNAKTSPTQTGIILGGTNGEVQNATLVMTGGKTEGIALSQRTMIMGKAVLDIKGGTVGNIYAGSYYNNDEKSSAWGKSIGTVNYGMAAAIDVRVAKGVSYNEIYGGYQFYPEEMKALKDKFSPAADHPAVVNAGFSQALVNVTINEKPNQAYEALDRNKGNLSLLRTAGLSNVTVTDNTIVAEVPTVDPQKPVEKVEAGVKDEESAKTIGEDVSGIVTKVLQEGKDASLENVVSSDSTPVAEKIANALDAGKTITSEVSVSVVEPAAVPQGDKTLIEKQASDGTVAQYLNIEVLLKAGDETIGKITKLSKGVTYTIVLPKDLAQKKAVTFYVLRAHEGKVTKLPLTKVAGSENAYTFTTDLYSTYALAYTETKSTSSGSSSSGSSSTPAEPVSPPTGENASFPVFSAAMLLLAAAGMTAALLLRKRACRSK